MSDITFSVVIPCKNERHFIGTTIAALQREQREYGLIKEIVVVDNGSTDDSVTIAESNGVTVLHCSGTISAVRNFGVSHTSGEYLAFVDADIEVRPGWSQQACIAFTELGDAAATSLVGYPCDVPDKPSWIEAVWFTSLISRKTIHYIGAANLFISRTLFDELGGFDDSLFTGEDVDLCGRARQRGHRVILDPRLQVVHHGYPKSLKGFYARERWHGIASQKRGAGVLGSKAGWLALFTLLYGLLFLLGLVSGFAAEVIALTVVGLVLAAVLCAKRLNDFRSLQPLRLCLLFVVYAIARAHSLVDSLLHVGKAREYTTREKEYSGH